MRAKPERKNQVWRSVGVATRASPSKKETYARNTAVLVVLHPGPNPSKKNKTKQKQKKKQA